MGVGNVGYFQKLFLKEKTDGVSEEEKHRTSLSKSTEVLPRKYGGLYQRSPMFLFSERMSRDRRLATQIRRNANRFPPY